MIHHVTGRLSEKTPGRAVVEVGGLGLEVLVSNPTWNDLGGPGDTVRLLIHSAVREDGWTLFGFALEEERALFRLLLGVQGIGPRVALAVLSGTSPSRLRDAVGEADVDVLVRVPGIGKKTAERIIVDLKDKLGEFSDAVTRPSAADDRDEAVDALVALGYPRPAARAAVRGARVDRRGNEVPAETVVKEALRHL